MSRNSLKQRQIPEIKLTRPQQDPVELFTFGYNIGASIVETLLVYLQGIFMTTDNLDHRYSYNEKESKIRIIDQGSFMEESLNIDPVIVVERGQVNTMNRGGLNRLAHLDWNTGDIEKLELFSCPVQVKVYGKYSHVEQYASLIFSALTFLTEPLRKFTIYSVRNPVMSGMRLVRRDSKPQLWSCVVSAMFLKEGMATIRRKDHPVLRVFAFKSRQVFDTGITDKVIIRIS